MAIVEKKIFSKPLEQFLVDKLKEQGFLTYEEIYHSYSSLERAKGFINRLEQFKVAKRGLRTMDYIVHDIPCDPVKSKMNYKSKEKKIDR